MENQNEVNNQSIQSEALLEIAAITRGLTTFNATYQKINEIALEGLEKSSKFVRYYEVKKPYYALIKAQSIEQANELYSGSAKFAWGAMGTEVEVREVSSDYALALYSYLMVRNQTDNVSVKDMLEKFRKEKSELLIINKSQQA